MRRIPAQAGSVRSRQFIERRRTVASKNTPANGAATRGSPAADSAASTILSATARHEPPGLDRVARAAISKSRAAIDIELVRRFNAGDESAFVEIMNHHQQKILAIALGRLRNRADAEEITQDTFIRAHRGLGRFRGDSSLATWLHHIAINLANNRYWYFFRRRRHATVSLDCPLSEDPSATVTDLVASEVPDPVREVSTAEFSALIATAMKKLEASHREILTLRNVLNRPYDEIARALAIKGGTVKSRIARARKNLRALLAEVCPEFSSESGPSDWFEPVRTSGRLVAA